MKKPGDISKRCFPPRMILFQTNPGGKGVFSFHGLYFCLGTSYGISWGFGTNSLKLLEPFFFLFYQH